MTEPAPMSCREFVELVTDYIEGALDDGTRLRFEYHMGLCPGCDDYLDQIRVTIQTAGSLEEEHLSVPARDRLLAAFRDFKTTA